MWKYCFLKTLYIKHFPYRYITQDIWEKTVDAYILELGFVLDCFFTPKIYAYVNVDDEDSIYIYIIYIYIQ